MASTTFDTLRVARDLEAAGVDRGQAEARAEALRQAATARHSRGSGNRDELATKMDLDTLEARMNARFEALEGRMYRMFWIQGGAIVAIMAALKLFG